MDKTLVRKEERRDRECWEEWQRRSITQEHQTLLKTIQSKFGEIFELVEQFAELPPRDPEQEELDCGHGRALETLQALEVMLEPHVNGLDGDCWPDAWYEGDTEPQKKWGK